MVGALVLVLVLAVLQLALTLWVRTTLIDASAEGARHAALLDGDLAAGEQRTREIVAMTLSGDFAESVTAHRDSQLGYDVVVVQITAPLPMLGLLGPSGVITVQGRAVAER